MIGGQDRAFEGLAGPTTKSNALSQRGWAGCPEERQSEATRAKPDNRSGVKQTTEAGNRGQADAAGTH